jgi:hypothetical protein
MEMAERRETEGEEASEESAEEASGFCAAERQTGREGLEEERRE